jgi:hypothetical protein
MPSTSQVPAVAILLSSARHKRVSQQFGSQMDGWAAIVIPIHSSTSSYRNPIFSLDAAAMALVLPSENATSEMDGWAAIGERNGAAIEE